MLGITETNSVGLVAGIVAVTTAAVQGAYSLCKWVISNKQTKNGNGNGTLMTAKDIDLCRQHAERLTRVETQYEVLDKKIDVIGDRLSSFDHKIDELITTVVTRPQ